ncbi:MAG: NAD(P)/FAD-dependent oxidoreductase [Methanocorpusculum sp.]|nr:NAD(P)/FAD-dependent oxidoreductase [Methanocorpusculum sp.]
MDEPDDVKPDYVISAAENRSTAEYDAVVIGGGPAGLFAAANLKGMRTVLLEKTDAPGKKLLLSGLGQCNITHAGTPAELLKHYGGGEHAAFLKPALQAFKNSDTTAFFGQYGISFETMENGKVFPESRSAKDILQALLAACKTAGAEVRTGCRVKSIAQSSAGFLIDTGAETFSAKYLIIACGGKSYPHTGSSGDGYLLAKSLGHTIVPPKEALTPVYVKQFPLKELSGISVTDATVRIFRNGTLAAKNAGDLLITAFGFSGPAVLDAGRWIYAGDILEISFVHLTPGAFDTLIIERCQNDGAKAVPNLFYDLGVPERLIHALLSAAGVSESLKGAQLSAAARKSLVRAFTAYRAAVDRTGDFSAAMATAGGVSLSEVNKKTCGSKICPNLFFAGEVLDIDGDTGGYNIQAAFSTAFLAASAIRAGNQADSSRE